MNRATSGQTWRAAERRGGRGAGGREEFAPSASTEGLSDGR